MLCPLSLYVNPPSSGKKFLNWRKDFSCLSEHVGEKQLGGVAEVPNFRQLSRIPGKP